MTEKEFLHKMMLVKRTGLINMYDKQCVSKILNAWGFCKYSDKVRLMSYKEYTNLLHEMSKYEQQYVKENEVNGKEN